MKPDWRASQPASIYNHPTVDIGEHFLSICYGVIARAQAPGRYPGRRAAARARGFSNAAAAERHYLQLLKEQRNADQASLASPQPDPA